MPSTRDPLQTQGHIQTESEGMETDYANGNKKKNTKVAIFILDKIDFKQSIKRDT